ncbi:MAG: lysophospholipid acyltransferase family protein [Marmoricola sp.]
MTGPYDGLPRTDDLKHPARLMLHRLRPLFAAAAHRAYDLTVTGAENVPATGPVILAANHIGFLDGPLMAIVGPRPVHALTKQELFSGPLGVFLAGSGQIPTERDEVDPRAVRTALRVLRDGGVAGVFPEKTRGGGEMSYAQGGAAYLAMVTGAPVVPMAFLGTRLPGSAASFPARGTRMVMSHGSPITVEQQGWPRRSADVRALTERIRTAIITTVQEAVEATGMNLPGPIPETDGTSPASGPASETSKDEQ